MSQRDFIIGSLHGVAPQALADLTPKVEPAVPTSLQGVQALAKALTRGQRLGSAVLHDVDRLYQTVRPRLLDAGASPAAAGVLLEAVLSALPRNPAADLALLLTGSLRKEQWPRVSTVALLALRDAASLAPPEENGDCLAQLDRALEERGASVRDVGGTWCVCDGVSPLGRVLAEASVRQLQRQGAAPGHKWVLVLSNAERDADAELLAEYARALARRFAESQVQNALCARDALVWTESRLKAQAERSAAWSRPFALARAALRRMVARLSPPEMLGFARAHTRSGVY